MLTSEIIEKLKSPFDPTDHKERILPGGGKWLFVPWQKIRDRLSMVCPDWQCSYSDPVIAGNLTVIRCRITIKDISREGIGNSESYPEKQRYGSPIELARCDAFKEAAEQFGVGAYLDDQKFVADYLRKKGDYRASGYLAQNQVRESGFKPKNPSQPISEDQLKRLYAIVAKKKISNEEAKKIINQFGYASSKEIAQGNYEAVIKALSDC